MPRGSKDARLERLEERARSRAASRRAQRRSEKPEKLSPEEQEERFLQSLQIMKILVEHHMLEVPPDQCPRNGPGDPLCSACRGFQEGRQSSAENPRLANDDEACEDWRAIAEVLPSVPDWSGGSALPLHQYPDEYE